MLRRRASYWLTVLAFVALGAVALGVFVLLPRWVSEPTVVADSHMDAEAHGEAPTAAVENPAQSPVPATPPPPETRQAPTIDTPVAAPAASSPTPPSPARSSPATTPREPAQAAFSRAMAEGLAQLDRGELATARAAFETALGLSPGSAGALEGLARVEAAEQLATIAEHRARATAFEAGEQWAEATSAYMAVLALDPMIRFAKAGLARASARSELSRQLEAHIERSDRLSDDGVLEQARVLLASAERIDSPGPLLTRQIEGLRQRIDVASTLINVVLLSDGLTDVLVYKVGRLGTFERQELELRPGIYTVVGSRAGYRDVRRRLEVTPNSAPSLSVRCEEKI